MRVSKKCAIAHSAFPNWQSIRRSVGPTACEVASHVTVVVVAIGDSWSLCERALLSPVTALVALVYLGQSACSPSVLWQDIVQSALSVATGRSTLRCSLRRPRHIIGAFLVRKAPSQSNVGLLVVFGTSQRSE